MARDRLKGAMIDAAVAGFAALAVAFVALVMPVDLLSGFVARTGLPAILPAAQPPLGHTARLALTLAASGFTFVLLMLALRLLSSVPRKRSQPIPQQAQAAPRLRRADAHPDAPSRVPISAMLELGTPLPPPWPEPEVDELDAQMFAAPPEVDKLDAQTLAAALEVDKVDAQTPWGAAGISLSATPPLRDERAPAQPAVPPLRGDETIVELMHRLEQRLAADGIAMPREAEAPVAARAGAADDRLREAIAELQQLTARR